MLQSITARKVAHIAIRARELDVKVARWDAPGDTVDADSILESRRGDATETELRAFISRLNDDEQAELVAVAWIGRGTFEPEEIAEAVETAAAEASTPTEDYLLGIPLLPDYLEEGLEKLGYDSSEIEDDIYRPG